MDFPIIIFRPFAADIIKAITHKAATPWCSGFALLHPQHIPVNACIKTVSKLTVFFEEPFWVGVFERETDDRYEVCKVIFGAEPKDCEVCDFMLKNYEKLRFSPSIKVGAVTDKPINPKRMQREINRQLDNTGIGTKAQQALKLQQEQCKLERKTRSCEQNAAEKERAFELRQEKRKEKHRGH